MRTRPPAPRKPTSQPQPDSGQPRQLSPQRLAYQYDALACHHLALTAITTAGLLRAADRDAVLRRQATSALPPEWHLTWRYTVVHGRCRRPAT